MRCGSGVGYKYHQQSPCGSARRLSRLSLPSHGGKLFLMLLRVTRAQADSKYVFTDHMLELMTTVFGSLNERNNTYRYWISICVSNFIKYLLIFSSSHASCSIKSWKCMEMWHWQFQNLDETCATISYVHHLIRIHLSRFLLNPNVRMCGLSRSALGAVLRAVHVLTGICWQ